MERADVQGLLFGGYGKSPYACFEMLFVRDPALARDWLGTILPAVDTGARRMIVGAVPGSHVQVAFSAGGLAALGVEADALETFPREFQEGMDTETRSRILGDTGASAPATWEFGGRRPVHVLLMLYAPSEAVLATLTTRFAEPALSRGLERVARLPSVMLPDDREHFGFRDGISQPRFQGDGRPPDPDEEMIAAGEFLLGYKNEYRIMPESPTIDPRCDPKNALKVSRDETTRKDLGANGTFLVFRKLHQRVADFWRYLADAAGGDEGEQIRLAAKLVGRWPSGAPLATSPNADDGVATNKFGFRDEDLAGLRCPIASHIRRCNPRDSLSPDHADSRATMDSRAVVRKHRLLRRGRPYGAPPADRYRADDAERGLYFIALNANLRRQFEFIQQTWLNNEKFGGLLDDKDPIAGDNDGTGSSTIPADPVRRRLSGMPRFVEVRGGEYFFMPGLRALSVIAGLRR